MIVSAFEGGRHSAWSCSGWQQETIGRHLIETSGVLRAKQVRLISDTTHELLRRVPDCLADVYRVGSTAPGKPLGPLTFIIITRFSVLMD